MFTKIFFYSVLFWILSASLVSAQIVDQDRKRQSDETIAGISCLNDDLFFDGVCRPPRYFQQFVASGYELSSVSGCGVRPKRPEDHPTCGATIVLSERNSNLTTRTITISAKTPQQLVQSRSRRAAIPLANSVRRMNTPQRSGKAVLAQTITHVQQEAGGSRLIETTQSLLGRGGKLIEVMTRDLLLNAVTDGAALQDYDVTGTLCALGDLDTLSTANSGSPDCSCRDEGRCGRTGFSRTGLSVEADGRGYSYCSKPRATWNPWMGFCSPNQISFSSPNRGDWLGPGW